MKKAPKTSRKRSWDWVSGLILLLAVFTAGSRLVATEWTDHLLRIQLLGVLAVTFGLALGASRFPRWLALAFSTLYAAFFIPWQLGSTILTTTDWNERLLSVGGRLLFSVNQLFQRQDVDDPILFLAMSALLLWAFASHAGYTLARQRDPWRATLPIGALLVLMHSYDATISSRVWYLAVYVLFALMLVARAHFLEQREKWQARRSHTPLYIGMDLLRASLGAAAILVLLAWATPAVASSYESFEDFWNTVTRPWNDVRDDVGRAFSSLEGQPVVITDLYGTELILGGGTARTEQILFTVEVLENNTEPVRYYWRDRIYDIYDDGGWATGPQQVQRVEGNEAGFDSFLSGNQTLSHFQITTGRSIFLLHTPSQPVAVSRNADIRYNSLPDGSLEIYAMRAPLVLHAGESYQVDSQILDVTIEELRAAGTDYPDWVTERYLQVPDGVSARTRELARLIAEGQENPYDVAMAVTNWLRQNIEYQEVIPDPPSDQDPIDWMLFDLQQAFCNYAASAQVIMLRELGIPARLAVGYAQGQQVETNLLLSSVDERDKNLQLEESLVSENNFYTVRYLDAHAWPEVYFPGIGWVEFEPTGNQQPLRRPLNRPEENDPLNQEEDSSAQSLENQPQELDAERLEGLLSEAEAAAAQDPLSRFRPLLFLAGGMLLLGLALFWRQRRGQGGFGIPLLVENSLKRANIQSPRVLRRWASYSQLPPLEQAYMEINRALGWIGPSPIPGNTPQERADSLARQLPELKDIILELNQQYQRTLYSPRAADIEQAINAQWAIRLAALNQLVRNWLDRVLARPKSWLKRLIPRTP